MRADRGGPGASSRPPASAASDRPYSLPASDVPRRRRVQLISEHHRALHQQVERVQLFTPVSEESAMFQKA